ncbi:STAS/SEC14 domain-containing protein [Methylomagnum ishizawai]|uniref:STAS/SEC14 domain-containing protein n=1 Tax=Methylomagnum ishizawai TaxID=1760988 RepID=UPI001C33422B|nr:STAS/SEC14 domain-containing protein [Methylomagnum ishizawai]BBL77240.1 STAS/SEC14 domain-containing protein [Methylomagnum ishizawai]
MITPIDTGSPRILGFKFGGKLRTEDYQTLFVPAVEAALPAGGGKARLLALFEDFHGWEAGAAWEDLKFGVRHYADFDRIALVGDRRWEAWMATLGKPFTQAEVRYFDVSDSGAAWAWIREGH